MRHWYPKGVQDSNASATIGGRSTSCDDELRRNRLVSWAVVVLLLTPAIFGATAREKVLHIFEMKSIHDRSTPTGRLVADSLTSDPKNCSPSVLAEVTSANNRLSLYFWIKRKSRNKSRSLVTNDQIWLNRPSSLSLFWRLTQLKFDKEKQQ